MEWRRSCEAGVWGGAEYSVTSRASRSVKDDTGTQCRTTMSDSVDLTLKSHSVSVNSRDEVTR